MVRRGKGKEEGFVSSWRVRDGRQWPSPLFSSIEFSRQKLRRLSYMERAQRVFTSSRDGIPLLHNLERRGR